LRLFDWLSGNSALTFARPWLLLLLLAIPLLAWMRGKSGPAAALTYSSTTSLRAIGKQSAARVGKILRALLLLALAFFVVALARPQLGKSLTQIEASGIDIMLVLDVSGSMLTKDFTIGGQEATRVDAIREVTRKFIEARPNDRIGIIAFAGREPDDAGSRLASAKFGSSKDRPRRRWDCDWIGHSIGFKPAK
jgi:Ca-activated chloride channel homolog